MGNWVALNSPAKSYLSYTFKNQKTMETIKPSVKKTKDAVAEAASTLGGFLAANFAMTLFEKFMPAYGKFSPALGVAGFVPHYQNANDNWKAFGNGVIAAGGAEALKKVTSGQTGFMAKLNAALPGRGTFEGLANYNAFPLRGLGASPVDEMLLSGGMAAAPGQRLLSDELLSM